MLPATNTFQVFTDPATLLSSYRREEEEEEELTAATSSLSLSSSSTPPNLLLSLLIPLSNPNILAQCRNPSSRYMTMSDGSQGALTTTEILSTASLSRDWRRAVLGAPVPTGSITFDLTLPTGIYWDTKVPRNGGICVEYRQVINMVCTIATGVKMRMGESGECVFNVEADDEDLGGEKLDKLRGLVVGLGEWKKGGGDEGWVVV